MKTKAKLVFWVDIPTKDCINNPDVAFENVADFRTKKAAVAFIRKHFGHCDDDGNICLITEGLV